MMAEAYVLLKVNPGDERNIVKLLSDVAEVKDINELYGEWDIIIKVAVKNIEELDPLLILFLRFFFHQLGLFLPCYCPTTSFFYNCSTLDHLNSLC